MQRDRQSARISGLALHWYVMTLIKRLFTKLTGASPSLDTGIDKLAVEHQPRNFFIYFIANCLGKIADELSSARLLLPWLFGSLGVPAALIGFLVPLREAGVLIPQLWISAFGQRYKVRKWLWSAGAGLSGMALILIATVSLYSTGWLAGVLMLVFLTLYSFGRGICSVTAKEVLGKIVAKSIRGRLMGWSASLSGISVVVIGLAYIQLEGVSQDTDLVSFLVVIAALLWGLAVFCFAKIVEPEQPLGDEKSIIDELRSQFRLLLNDVDLQKFIWVRGLLLASALAHPFIVILIQEDSGSDLSVLGGLLVISALASALASPFWGYFGDMDSPKVMAVASLISGFISLAVGCLALWGIDGAGYWLYAGAYAFITVAHSGVRLGRKVYLLDLTDTNNRGAYTALANTLIGCLMILAGTLGLVSQFLGSEITLILLGLVSFIAAAQALKLKPVV